MSNLRNLHSAADRFKALGNPHRLAILLFLAESCEEGGCEADAQQCVGDLGARLEIGAPSVSHHLKELRTAGLITMERRGQRIHCSLRPEALGLLSSPVVRSWLTDSSSAA
ncbi:MAG: metalloregulator ArsR/SmtB family transcription factor [Holophagales bacterium]|nr:metalloregulator ArsR/SmtB family transcription factor [Holophagales bacterium]